jgi:hypothetical protein
MGARESLALIVAGIVGLKLATPAWRPGYRMSD